MKTEDALRVKKITTDILSLKEFLDDIKLNLSPIKKMYIITDKDYRIELLNHFSIETTNALFNLIIHERELILKDLEHKLEQVMVISKTD